LRAETQLRNLCDHYRTQLALYREGVQRIWPDRRVQTCLLFTDGGRLFEIE
jgi:ATP-dependent exoDNAse (exonuclease V) beta subunit